MSCTSAPSPPKAPGTPPRSGCPSSPTLASPRSQMMPIADFAGRFGWGYDGVNLFAPSRLYGTPNDRPALRQRGAPARARGDPRRRLQPLRPRRELPARIQPDRARRSRRVGRSTINYDGEGSEQVREFVIQNAIYWIREFHFDGFRIDATQSLHDTSAEHIISEICRRCPRRRRRPASLHRR